MSQADAEAIRAYVEVLDNFAYVVTEAWDVHKPFWTSPEFSERSESILQQLQNRRDAALIAGVHSGYPVDQMIALLRNCEGVLNDTKTQEMHGNHNNYQYVAQNLSVHIPILNSLAILAQSNTQVKPPDNKSGEKIASDNAPPLNPTDRAVLDIIASQPEGRGILAKDIIRNLKIKGINIAITTLRRHNLKKLADFYGVINHPAAGGYLIKK